MERPAASERASRETVAGPDEASALDEEREEHPSAIRTALLDLLRRGHGAACWYADEVGGELRSNCFLVGDQVQCKVRLRGAEAERIIPFSELWRLANGGFVIEDVAPPFDCLLWEALALEHRFEEGRAGALVPKVYAAAARDNTRGLASLVYSKCRGFGRDTLGERLTRALQTTQIDGAAKRIRRAREQLSNEEARAATAAGVCTHLRGEGAGRDGGLPPAEFIVLELDLASQTSKILAQAGDWTPVGLSQSKRRSQLSGAVLRELENDAFGGRPSPSRTHEPLDESFEDRAVSDFSDDVESHLDLVDLVERAGLSKREREVVELRVADKSQAEIAALLDIKVGTVKALFSRAKRKLQASMQRPEGPGQAV